MKPEITLQYNNLNELTIEQNIKEIVNATNLGKVRVNVVDCSYIISQTPDKNLQIKSANPESISAKSIAIKKKLIEFLNIKPLTLNIINPTADINNGIENKNIAITPENNFQIFASEKLQLIEKLTNLLSSSQQKQQEIEATFKLAEKQGGAYKAAIFGDNELLDSYNSIVATISEQQHQISIEKHQLETIQKLYKDYVSYIDKNDLEAQKSAYEFACSECHYLEQQTLMEEVAKLSENMVSIAQQNNSAIVFPGRSLIACAAYIEKNHPEIKVVKMPLSGAKKLSELENIKSVNKIYEYANKYLVEASKQNNLLIADYVNSGGGLAAVKDITINNGYKDKATYVAVYSKYSKVKSNKGLIESGNILTNTSFDNFIQAGNDKYSPLANALHSSTFDGVSPYGRYELKKILNNEPEPHGSQDGFNLLKKISD